MNTKVIAGSKKGFVLEIPKSSHTEVGDFETRAMMDRVKSAIFSIIQDRIPNARIADLYAGSGALGIEALSRGADYALFVDISKEACKVIKANLNKCGFQNSSKVVCKNANKYLKNRVGVEQDEMFDIIFISPPWAKFSMHTLKLSPHILSKDGIVIVEREKSRILPDRVGELVKIDERMYGRTMVSLLCLRRGDTI